MDVEQVFEEIGGMGSMQRRLMWMIVPMHGFLAFHQVHNVFVGAEPKFQCKLGGKLIDGCPPDGQVCEGYEFRSNFTSVVSEWNLVCEDTYKSGLVQSMLMVGILLGSLVFGSLADQYGRKPVVCGCILGVSVFSLCGAFASGYVFYVAMRFLVGMTCGGYGMVSFVMLTEVIGASKRGFVGMIMPLVFAVGIGLYALLAYFLRDWRVLSIVTACPGFIGLLYIKMLPESPRWLLSQGRTEQAQRMLQYFATVNLGHKPKVPITLRTPSSTNGEHRGRKSDGSSMLDLVRHPVLRSRTANNCYTWFVNCAVYYGLTMSAGSLGGDMYLSVALSGLAEIPADLLAFYLMDRVGRKYTYSASMLVAGILCIVILLLPSDQTNARTTLAVLGKVGISVSFCVAWLYGAELYPTSIRNKAMSICNMSARVGGVVAPLIISMGVAHRNVDFLVFGVITLIAGLVSLRLPETLNQPMPDTVEDLDVARGQRSPWKNEVTSLSISEDKVKLLQQEIEFSGEDDEHEML